MLRVLEHRRNNIFLFGEFGRYVEINAWNERNMFRKTCCARMEDFIMVSVDFWILSFSAPTLSSVWRVRRHHYSFIVSTSVKKRSQCLFKMCTLQWIIHQLRKLPNDRRPTDAHDSGICATMGKTFYTITIPWAAKITIIWEKLDSSKRGKWQKTVTLSDVPRINDL